MAILVTLHDLPFEGYELVRDALAPDLERGQFVFVAFVRQGLIGDLRRLRRRHPTQDLSGEFVVWLNQVGPDAGARGEGGPLRDVWEVITGRVAQRQESGPVS